MKSMYSILLLSFSVTILTISCGKEEKSPTVVKNYTEEIIDGVRNIHNLYPKYETSPIKLEFIRKWGGLETDEKNYMLFKPNDIGIDSKDGVYIADTGNHRVQKYDSSGKYQ